ncbi:hypothetical protein THAOC_28108 [Thalassiosira oceanica]|uniref:Uncharacterized protein n=1 Tax=Thalassiosira oceanica TaxID=159749 RepID=K0RUR8_THAOC|nr:hypothetical protein THAOC_28108 [Thalassiosira oceanica]|eukprot:EJK52596.1 hypothetical protein THAOC_28108 [Thalassiosira oceanica]
MASYDARGHGGWRSHVNDGVYTPVTSHRSALRTRMTVAGGAVITPRMLDVLSSDGGATNGQALAQGPYLKIRWAVGVSEDDGIGEGGSRRHCGVDDGGARPGPPDQSPPSF